MSNTIEGEMGSAAPTRRVLVAGLAGMAGLASGAASGQARDAAEPRSVVSRPPRDFGPGAPPSVYDHDPDIVLTDPAFRRLVQGNAAIERLWTGGRWLEGPAWNALGRFLVFSDIPNDRQMRWIEDDGRVSVFRRPSGNSNGNTFDRAGRQIACEHLNRRVVRYELDGSATVLADSFDGKRLNSPNDAAPHPDGSVWFTDPPYGGQLYEGAPDEAGGPSNPDGLLNPRLGQPAGLGRWRRELPSGVYRLDPSGRLDLAIPADRIRNANGLCFSPDGRRLYVASTGPGPGDDGQGGDGAIHVVEIGGDGRAGAVRRFTDCRVDGVHCAPDGVRCDVGGNVWASANAGRTLGYSGVTVWSPEGALLGRIRLPEVCGNLAFGGPKRNRLFMTASRSLYALFVATQGAAPG